VVERLSEVRRKTSCLEREGGRQITTLRRLIPWEIGAGERFRTPLHSLIHSSFIPHLCLVSYEDERMGFRSYLHFSLAWSSSSVRPSAILPCILPIGSRPLPRHRNISMVLHHYPTPSRPRIPHRTCLG